MVSLATILRHEAQLRQASREIKEARGIIDDASKAANQAAEALLANWEGSAADAFAREQLGFRNWVQVMVGLIEQIVGFIDSANDAYSQVDAEVANMINSK